MHEPVHGNPHELAGAGVVVGVDGTPGAETALRWAARYAAAHRRPLQILYGMDLVGMSRVVGPYEVVTPPVIDTVRARAKTVLRHASETATALEPDLRVQTHAYADAATALLVERSRDAFAVVLGATGDTGTLAHLGSTLLAVTAHAHGPVVVVRADPEADNTVHDSGPVVVGVDGGPLSDPALAAAFAEAATRGADLVAVHVWSDWDLGTYMDRNPGPALEDVDAVEEAILAERLAGWQEKYPDVTVIRRVYVNGPAQQLLEWSATAQLLVVGNRGRGGFLGLLLGSTAHSLVQHARCPVLVVHTEH